MNLINDICMYSYSWSDAIARDEIATVHHTRARQTRNMNVAHDHMHLSKIII